MKAWIEILETRRLMDASIRGVLTVTGTPQSDVIVVNLNATDAEQLDVTTNGVVESFALEDVDRIAILGLNGHDNIRIDDSNGEVGLDAFMFGSNGRDTLIGGAGDEHLKGGTGNDSLDGGDGDDELDGGAGADVIIGAEGQDVFQGTDDDTEITELDEDDGVRIALSDAPQRVQDTINRVGGNARLTGLFRETDEGETVYEAEFDQARFERSLKINSEGVLIEDETEIDVSALPTKVRNAIFALYPEAEITEAEIALIRRKSFFEVEVEVDGEVHELLIRPNGQVQSDEIEE